MTDTVPPDPHQALLLRAIELPVEERAAFLERETGGDVKLRKRVERLIAAHERAAHMTGGKVVFGLGRYVSGPGDRIGPYELLETLGEGGMGTVFLAQQAEPIRRQVALKVIRLGMDTDQVVARFEAERQALAMMDHPCIARVFDAGATAEGRPYFVMELVRGTSITDYCDEKELGTEARLELFLEACSAVQHAHQRGIIHRDLKPSNVLVSEVEGLPVPKVIDFGIAKATGAAEVDGTRLLTVQAQILGTPEYMSPEQANGSGDVDTRTDVYSLGVLLYELLTGSRPLELEPVYPEGLQAVLEYIARVEPERPSTNAARETNDSRERAERRGRRPSQLARQIRGDLDWIVLKALEKDRARRYESASALAADVRRYLDQMPVEAGPPSGLYIAAKFAARHRIALAAAGAVLLALIGGVGALVWSLERVKDERDNVILAQEGERRALKAVQGALAEVELERDRAEAARERAEDDRDEAQEISDFFTDMIQSTDPRRQGRDVLVRSVLHQAEHRLEREFEARPAVRARIGAALGSAYGSLGEYKRSHELLARSAATHLELYGPDDPETVLTEGELGVALIQKGDYEEARAQLESALSRATAVYGPENANTLRIRGNLAIVIRNLEPFAVAEETYRDLVADCTEHLGVDHAVTLNTLLGFIQLYLENRRAPDAEVILAETIESLSASPGHDDPAFLRMQIMQADLLRWRGDLDGAVELSREIVSGHERMFGPEHPKTHEAMQSLASLLELNGAYDEALALIDEVIPRHRDLLGLDHTSTLAAERLKGVILWKLSRLDEAREVLVGARERLYRQMGPEHADSRDITNLLAIVHYMSGDYAEALEMWTAQFDAILATEGEDSVATIAPRVNLGMVYSKIGRLDEAEECYSRGLELSLAAYGPNGDWTLRVQNNLALLYRNQGDYEAAAELNADVLARRRQQFGEGHPDTLGSLVNQGDYLLRCGNSEESRAVLDQALTLCLEALGEEHALTLHAMTLLGRAALEQGDHAAALDHLERSYEGSVRVMGESHGQALIAQQALARAMYVTGAPEEALELIEDAFEAGEARIADGALEIADSLELLARIRGELDDAEGAEQALARRRERVLRRAAAEGASWVALARGAEVLLESGAEEDAERALELARRLTDQQSTVRPAANQLLARCYSAVGQRDVAVGILERTLADLPEDHRLRESIAATLASVAAED